MSEALEFGIVGVNDINPTAAAAPFGGVKYSGLGREGATHGIDEYLDTKLVGTSLLYPRGRLPPASRRNWPSPACTGPTGLNGPPTVAARPPSASSPATAPPGPPGMLAVASLSGRPMIKWRWGQRGLALWPGLTRPVS